jgi:hypothetical protein
MASTGITGTCIRHHFIPARRSLAMSDYRFDRGRALALFVNRLVQNFNMPTESVQVDRLIFQPQFPEI